jgi:hypothetical protein
VTMSQKGPAQPWDAKSSLATAMAAAMTSSAARLGAKRGSCGLLAVCGYALYNPLCPNPHCASAAISAEHRCRGSAGDVRKDERWTEIVAESWPDNAG